MLRGSRSRARIALLIAASALVPVVVGSTANIAEAASASFLGPPVSRAENATTSWGRDGGISVPLPDGRVFFIFGDTPRYTYTGGQWKLTGFIFGSSAGEVAFKPGHPPSAPFYEVVAGKSLSSSNQPHQFLPTPRLYLPNGKLCNKANGGPSTGAARWPTGAAVMPDKTNILIPYIGVCVVSASKYYPQSWGFAEFNWKTNRFSVAPVDVYPASKSNPGLPFVFNRYSPVISGHNVTFFSNSCCASDSHTFATTLPANTSALRKRASYKAKVIPGLFPAPVQSVVPPTKAQPHLTMYQQVDTVGRYRLLKASKPSGPWKVLSTGTLPRCNKSPTPCISAALHPWFSTSSRMLVSYYLPGFGPGVPNKHPYPHPPLGHVVMSYIPG